MTTTKAAHKQSFHRVHDLPDFCDCCGEVNAREVMDADYGGVCRTCFGLNGGTVSSTRPSVHPALVRYNRANDAAFASRKVNGGYPSSEARAEQIAAAANWDRFRFAQD